MIDRLYRVITIADYRGFKNVRFDWFLDSGATRPVAPYADLISDHADLPDPYDAEEMVDEFFTEDEARALLAWLNEHRGGATHSLEEHAMPIKGRTDNGAFCGGLGSIPVGGPQDFLSPNKEEWDLPFNVLGYFDLRFAESAASPEAMEQRPMKATVSAGSDDHDDLPFP